MERKKWFNKEIKEIEKELETNKENGLKECKRRRGNKNSCKSDNRICNKKEKYNTKIFRPI